MLVIDKAVKYFHKGSVNEVLALDGIELTVEKGDFITIIGSNGAGKSTLLSLIAGEFTPDTGRLVLNGDDITNAPEYARARYIGRVRQDPLMGTAASMSIEQNMALADRRGKARTLAPGVRAADRERFRNRLKLLGLGLEDRLSDRVGLLSGGQRQALTMLMATMIRPELLLLDEHTAALDPKTAHQILDLTESLVVTGELTTLMVTHNMNQALALGNRLIMLHQGKIILDIKGEEKRNLKVADLLARFYTIRGEEFSSDKMLLA